LAGNTPTAAEAYNGGTIGKVYKNTTHHLTDGGGSYIIKPVSIDIKEISGCSYSPFNLMYIEKDDEYEKILNKGKVGDSRSSSVNYNSANVNIGWYTHGDNGSDIYGDAISDRKSNPISLENFTIADGADYVDYYNLIKDRPCAFIFNEDPRFYHAEPNRGLTSPPIK
jgi:hypothetical protein